MSIHETSYSMATEDLQAGVIRAIFEAHQEHVADQGPSVHRDGKKSLASENARLRDGGRFFDEGRKPWWR